MYFITLLVFEMVVDVYNEGVSDWRVVGEWKSNLAQSTGRTKAVVRSSLVPVVVLSMLL